ncbi:hypothetical protein E4L95_18875 [Paracoccus liaowanqingii]|uniref:Uncharacterized protein n=1 Tax=Paracoccus liaowanqingii TaxID=2560053 RepID=A0A4Z1CDS7_9RHOB|nr:hypothetical protein [Paracoccus liaowanqingii]TGN48684.1 hypothetical protein E4L95_18875 [Paracoccus liaowanqingii]
MWRHTRPKKACVEAPFRSTDLRFIELPHAWPDRLSSEAYLHDSLVSMLNSDKDIRDGIAVARLVSRFTSEPVIRSAYLMASTEAEDDLFPILARRSSRSCTTLTSAFARQLPWRRCASSMGTSAPPRSPKAAF